MAIHVVQSGDTLGQIAADYGVSVAHIIFDNGLDPGETLVIGQALLITIPIETYTVQWGDTLYAIAVQTGVTVIRLIQNNPELAIEQDLSPGQRLVIRFEGQGSDALSVGGYAYPYIGREVLRRALPFLTYLNIFSYGFTETGQLTALDDEELIRQAYEFQVAPVLVFSGIGNGNFEVSFDILLEDLVFQNRVIDNLIDVMLEKGYLGLDVDFEYIPPEQTQNYAAFLENIRERLHELGFFLQVDLAPKTYADQPGLLYEAHDYAVIGGIADRVLLMTYEWGYTYGPPMSVAPINQVRRVVEYGVSEIPPEKILMGIPNYGYDWTLPYEKGISRATSIGNQEAISIARRNGAQIQFDELSKSPFFTYVRDGAEHVVWFEDVRSIEQKLMLREEFALHGVSYWNIMRPFAQNWAFLGVNYDIVKIT